MKSPQWILLPNPGLICYPLHPPNQLVHQYFLYFMIASMPLSKAFKKFKYPLSTGYPQAPTPRAPRVWQEHILYPGVHWYYNQLEEMSGLQVHLSCFSVGLVLNTDPISRPSSLQAPRQLSVGKHSHCSSLMVSPVLLSIHIHPGLYSNSLTIISVSAWWASPWAQGMISVPSTVRQDGKNS